MKPETLNTKQNNIKPRTPNTKHMPTETAEAKALADVLRHIRPAVREQHPYVVGSPAEAPVKLNQNESPYDLPGELRQEVMEAFFQTPFNRYPAEQPHRLRAALAERTGYDPDGLLIGNGSNELTYTFGLTMIEKGTSVVLPRPMFALYEKVVRLHEGNLISVPPRDDLSFDAEALLDAVRTSAPALTVLTTPNNPTGLAMPLEEIEAIVQAASGFVVVDEAYVEFTEEESARSILERYPNLILLRTFSKAFGLAGLRLGYLMTHPDVARELLKARLPFMVDRFAEAVALALLARPDLVEERVGLIKASCRALTQELAALPDVRVLPSQANFVLFQTPLEPTLLLARLAEEGVLVRNMGGYPELQGFLRVNAGTAEENQAFLMALKKTLRLSGAS